MKNLQKGFIMPLLLALIATLLIGGGVYIYETKKVEVPAVVDSGTQQTNTQTPPVNTPTNNPSSQTDTPFKILSPKAGDSWEIGGTYSVKFQNLPKGSFVQVWLQNKNEASTGTANIGVVETGRDGNPSLDVQITVPSQWCGGDCGKIRYVAPGQYRLLIRIYPSVNSSYQTFYSDYFTLTSSNNSQSVSVSGMSKYTTTDLGFSFWYPSSWKVVEGQESIRMLDSQRRDTDLWITRSTPTNGKLLLPGYACGPAEGCTDLTYYFDVTTNTWMEQHGTQDPIPANVSTNTMGGLHMLNGNIRFGLGTVIPLGAHSFLMVGASPGGLGGGEHNFQDYLAKTIVATDQLVATPASSAEQTATIQAEAAKYGI